MEKVGLVYSDIYVQHETGMGHPETKDRLRATLSQLKKQQMFGKQSKAHFIQITPRQAEEEEITWLHSPHLIQLVKKQSQRARQEGRLFYLDSLGGGYGETVASAYTRDAALQAAGGNFTGIDAIFQGTTKRNFVLCRPPGHHSNYDEARGFCVYNNILLTAEYLFQHYNLEKIAIIDFDAHAGNGTEELLNSHGHTLSGEVLCISMHQHPHTLYPGTCFIEDIGTGPQQGKTVNITFYPYSGHECVKTAFQQFIHPIVDQFHPEFLLISAGYDAHHADPLTALGFMDQTYSYMMEEITKMANHHTHGRIQCTLEGGYNLQALGRSIANTLAVMADDKPLFEEKELIQDTVKAKQYLEDQLIPSLKEVLEPYWKL